MAAPSLHVLHDVDVAVFVGNDALACRMFEIGKDSCSVTAPCVRASGVMVRLRCHLDDAHWLDADALLTDCQRFGRDWHWHLAFVQGQSMPVLDQFLARRRGQATAPARSATPTPSSMRPPAK